MLNDELNSPSKINIENNLIPVYKDLGSPYATDEAIQKNPIK